MGVVLFHYLLTFYWYYLVILGGFQHCTKVIIPSGLPDGRLLPLLPHVWCQGFSQPQEEQISGVTMGTQKGGDGGKLWHTSRRLCPGLPLREVISWIPLTIWEIDYWMLLKCFLVMFWIVMGWQCNYILSLLWVLSNQLQYEEKWQSNLTWNEKSFSPLIISVSHSLLLPVPFLISSSSVTWDSKASKYLLL